MKYGHFNWNYKAKYWERSIAKTLKTFHSLTTQNKAINKSPVKMWLIAQHYLYPSLFFITDRIGQQLLYTITQRRGLPGKYSPVWHVISGSVWLKDCHFLIHSCSVRNGKWLDIWNGFPIKVRDKYNGWLIELSVWCLSGSVTEQGWNHFSTSVAPTKTASTRQICCQ